MSPRAEQVKADARLGAPCPSSSLSGRRLADPLWHQSSVIMYQNRRQRDGRGASSSPLDTRYFCKASVSTRREKKKTFKHLAVSPRICSEKHVDSSRHF